MKKLTKVFCLLVLALTLILGCKSQVQKRSNKEADKKVKEKTQSKKSAGSFEVTSTAFKDGGEIPVKYAKSQVSGGQNTSISLAWKNVPEGTKSIAVTIVDIDANNFLHWLVINIDPRDTPLKEGSSGKSMPSFATEFKNDYGKTGYGGPAPPPGEKHEYEITIWALNISSMGMTENSGLKEFQSFVKGKVLDKAIIIGKFEQ